MIKIDELIYDSGKQTAVNAAKVVLENPKLLKELLKIAFEDKAPMSTRAANVIEICDANQPGFARKYLIYFLENIPKFKTDGVKRCLIKCAGHYCKTANDDELGRLVDICFKLMLDAKESIAVKAYTMNILIDIAKKLPDIKPELISSFEFLLLDHSTGIKTKAKKELQFLKKKK